MTDNDFASALASLSTRKGLIKTLALKIEVARCVDSLDDCIDALDSALRMGSWDGKVSSDLYGDSKDGWAAIAIIREARRLARKSSR